MGDNLIREIRMGIMEDNTERKKFLSISTAVRLHVFLVLVNSIEQKL